MLLFAATLLSLLPAAITVDIAADQPLAFIYIDDPLVIELSADEACRAEVLVTLNSTVLEAPIEKRFEDISLSAKQVRWLMVDALPPKRGYYEVAVHVTVGEATYDRSLHCCRIDRLDGAQALPMLIETNTTLPQLDTALNALALAQGAFPTDFGGEMAITADDETALTAILDAGRSIQYHPTLLSGSAATPPALAPYYHLTEARGLEKWPFNLRLPQARSVSGQDAAWLVKYLLTARAMGYDSMLGEAQLLFDGAPLESYSYMNGLVHRFTADAYWGSLPGNDATVWVFRRNGAWFAALWADTATTTVSIPVGDAQQLVLTDAMNNPLPVPALQQGAISLSLSTEPVYLTGQGGTLLQHVAAAESQALATAMAANPTYEHYLGEPFVTPFRLVAENPLEQATRAIFLELLQNFPELEGRWHAGQLPRTVAVPLLADMAQLTRWLCQLEAARGEAFLEPMGATLARCKEYQSLYLTGSVGTPQARLRGDWLLAEVRRLMEEARKLAEAQQDIEANALASLAEWRARALVHAMKAGPLSERTEEEITLPEEEEAAVLEALDEPQRIVHTVAKNENPSTIAKKYGVEVKDLLEWNDLDRRDVLNIGDELVVLIPPKP